MKEAKEVEYPVNGTSIEREGKRFMRLAFCNRKVIDQGERPVYHIDMTDK